MKYKWTVPFIFWIPYGLSAARMVASGVPTDLGIRVAYTFGTIFATAIMLAIVKPWERDAKATGS